MKKIALLLIAVVTLFAACTPKNVDATLTVKPAELKVKVGESARISVSVEPAGDYEFEWKSADETIATVAEGIVTGVAKGETSVTVNIKGSSDVKTVKVSVVGELDAVKYWGAYLMLGDESPLYTLQNQETGEETPVTPMDYMFVPENFYVNAGSFAGSWDYPIFATTSVEDRRHLADDPSNEKNGYIMVFGYYSVAPVATSVITDVNEAGDDIVAPYYFVADDFNKDVYEKYFHEIFINGADPNAIGAQYEYMHSYGAVMYKMSMDDQMQYLVGYPTGEGLVYIPGYPEGDDVYFADIAYDFHVKYFTNPDYYGLEVAPKIDEETGEYITDEEGNVAMYFPTDEAGNPYIKMAEMTDYHFVGGSIEFPTEEAAAPRAGLTSAAVKKISSVNNMILKSVTYNRDLQKVIR